LTKTAWLLFAFTALCARSAPLDGPHIFSNTCAACHGLDGHGGEHAPDIATATNIRAMTDEELTHTVKNGIPAAGMPGFGASLNPVEITAVVAYLRELQGQQNHAVLPGNPEHGRRLFFADSSCALCHLVDGQGGFIGPSLSGYGKIHGETEIREAVLDPGKSFNSRYAMAEVVTHQSNRFNGVIRNEDNFSLQLQGLDGTFYFVKKTDILTIKRQTQSIMPADYATRLSKSDIDDLVAYLMTAVTGKPSQKQGEDDN